MTSRTGPTLHYSPSRPTPMPSATSPRHPAVGPAGPEAFAASCRASLSETIASCDELLSKFFPEDATALTLSETALVLPPAVRVERRLVVEARVKTAASALRKMLGSANTKAVRDVLGFRVIVLGARADEDAHHSSLYAVRDALHCLGNELKHRSKDYVQAPKPSGYRSLHSTLLRPLDGLLVEVQVRSRDMHWHATFGDAAHAKYKVDRRDRLERRGAGAARRPPTDRLFVASTAEPKSYRAAACPASFSIGRAWLPAPAPAAAAAAAAGWRGLNQDVLASGPSSAWRSFARLLRRPQRFIAARQLVDELRELRVALLREVEPVLLEASRDDVSTTRSSPNFSTMSSFRR